MIKKSYMQSMVALGGTVELQIIASEIAFVEEIFNSLWEKVHTFENRFSRFKPDSELSQFNLKAGKKISISSEFHDLLVSAKYHASISEGLFNPFVLPSLYRAGYKNSMLASNLETVDVSGGILVNFDVLELGDDFAKIPENTSIDMGGIGKGYLADQLAIFLSGKVQDFCLSLGGDLHVSGHDVDGPWKIAIQSAKDRSKNIGYYSSVSGDEYGIATSGSLRIKSDQAQNHIIDPRTEKPLPSSTNICTVISRGATTSDVMASNILIAGRKYAATKFEQGIISAVLLQDSFDASPFMLGEDFFLQ